MNYYQNKFLIGIEYDNYLDDNVCPDDLFEISVNFKTRVCLYSEDEYFSFAFSVLSNSVSLYIEKFKDEFDFLRPKCGVNLNDGRFFAKLPIVKKIKHDE